MLIFLIMGIPYLLALSMAMGYRDGDLFVFYDNQYHGANIYYGEKHMPSAPRERSPSWDSNSIGEEDGAPGGDAGHRVRRRGRRGHL